MQIAEFQQELIEWGKRMGWNDDRDIPTLIALMHSELSEALEEYRNGHTPTEIYYNLESDKPEKPEGIPVELADVIIRILHCCAHYGIDMENALRIKQDYNTKRKFRHGGKVI